MSLYKQLSLCVNEIYRINGVVNLKITQRLCHIFQNIRFCDSFLNEIGLNFDGCHQWFLLIDS